MMTRKWLLYSIPALMILLFSGVFISGSFLKHPLGKDDRIMESMKKLEQHVKEQKWEQAKKESDYSSHAWNDIISTRVQFSVEREYMYDINSTLARIKGGIVAKDDKTVIEEVYFFYDLWKNLGK